MRTNDTSYLTRDIFEEYLTKVFLKYVATLRASMNLHDSPAVLLCDNCTAYVDGDIKVLLTGDNIHLLAFPLHTSHLFHPLDLVTLAVFKRKDHDLSVRLPKDSQAWQTTKLMRALECVRDSRTNRAAFKRAGQVMNPAVFPPIAIPKWDEFLALIAKSQLSGAAPSLGDD